MPVVGLYRTVGAASVGQYGVDWGAGTAASASGSAGARGGARCGASGGRRIAAAAPVVLLGALTGASGQALIVRRAGAIAGARAAATGEKAAASGAASLAGALAGAVGDTSAAGRSAPIAGGAVGAVASAKWARGRAATAAGALAAVSGVAQLIRMGAASARAGARVSAAGNLGALNTDHVREQIRDTVVGWMAALSGIDGRAYSSRVFAIQSGQFPAIIVYTVDDRVIEQTMGLPEIQVRELELAIQAYAKDAADVDGALDGLAVQIESRMATDHNINTLAKSTLLTGTDIAMVEGETAIGTCTLTYSITYVIDPAAPYLPLQ